MLHLFFFKERKSCNNMWIKVEGGVSGVFTVSYTHLDVYKRQLDTVWLSELIYTINSLGAPSSLQNNRFHHRTTKVIPIFAGFPFQLKLKLKHWGGLES